MSYNIVGAKLRISNITYWTSVQVILISSKDYYILVLVAKRLKLSLPYKM